MRRHARRSVGIPNKMAEELAKNLISEGPLFPKKDFPPETSAKRAHPDVSRRNALYSEYVFS